MPVAANLRRFGRQRTRYSELPFPAGPHLRVAQLSAKHLFQSVQVFLEDRWRELETYRPQVLVGSAAELQRLGLLDLRTVDHAVFVLTECGDKPLSDMSRVVLWQTYGVPVYELFLGLEGILACECEAHEGWHVQPYARFSLSHGELVVDAFSQKALPTGLFGYIETAACDCGRPGSRVMALEGHASKKVPTELAATA